MDVSEYIEEFPNLLAEFEDAVDDHVLDEEVIEAILNRTTKMYSEIEWLVKGGQADELEPLTPYIEKYTDLIETLKKHVIKYKLDIELKQGPAHIIDGRCVPYIQ